MLLLNDFLALNIFYFFPTSRSQTPFFPFSITGCHPLSSNKHSIFILPPSIHYAWSSPLLSVFLVSYATSTNLFPNTSIVSESLLNIFKLIRYSIISFILCSPLLLATYTTLLDPSFFLETGTVARSDTCILQLWEMLNIINLIIFTCIFWLTWVLNFLDYSSNFLIYHFSSLFDVIHLG